MNRRQMVSLLGGVGAAAAFKVSPVLAQEHPQEQGGTGEVTAMAPLTNHHLHFCGFHVVKTNPKIQIVTQHYCGMLGGDMHQCLLYDSVEKGAKLLGVEYIVPDELFRNLPDHEKKYWHPHTYEVLGGGLVAPSMDKGDELALMKVLLNTWGKTWHTWPDPSTPVPMGEPLLMWALTADGQEDNSLVEKRDKQFSVSTPDLRKERIAAIGYQIPSVPQPTDINAIGRQWTATGDDRPSPVGR